jgi:type III secretion system YscQ/HrcQ family protein
LTGDVLDPVSPGAPGQDAGQAADVLGPLPNVSRRQTLLERQLVHGPDVARVREAPGWLREALGAALEFGPAEIIPRASGLGRPGVIAQLSWPRLSTRLALALETPVAHALVDHLLGFERLAGEHRLQVTPVEWGILMFVVARTIDRLGESPGALGAWDLVVDRVGPEPFRPEGLGPVLTLRWPTRVGAVSGSTRLWVAESLVDAWVAAPPSPPADLDAGAIRGRFGSVSGVWKAEAGTVSMPRGLGRLRVGGVLPIDGFPLRGTVASPSGPIALALRDRDGRSFFSAEAAPMSAGARLTLTAPLRRESTPSEARPVSIPTDPSAAPTAPVSPTDIPVTLTVELGRINLPLTRLADLKPGDVVELARHAREPVELTSNGRLVARGELVQIETELGVRVLSVFL